MKITAYTLSDFCREIQAAIKQGYEFDFDSNDHYPQTYGSFHECTMVKVEKQPETNMVLSAKQEPEVKPTKAQRKNSVE